MNPRRKKSLIIILISLFALTGAYYIYNIKDRSFTTRHYEKAGIPDINKNWDNSKYLQAVTALGSIKRYHPLSLPRKNSLKSGRVFKKLTDPENFAFSRDKNLMLASRARDLQYFSIFQNSLRDVYMDPLSEDQIYNKELVDIFIFGLSVYNTMLNTAIEIGNSTDEDVRVMQRGTATVIISYCNFLNLVLSEQTKSKNYSPDQLDRLSAELANSIGSNISWLNQTDKSKIIKGLNSVINSSAPESSKSTYKRVIETLGK